MCNYTRCRTHLKNWNDPAQDIHHSCYRFLADYFGLKVSIHYFSCSINILKLSELLKLFCYALGHFYVFHCKPRSKITTTFRTRVEILAKTWNCKIKYFTCFTFFTVQQYDFEKWNETWNYYCTPCVPRQSEPVKIIDNNNNKKQTNNTLLLFLR